MCTEGAKREISMLIGQAFLVKLSCAKNAQHQFYTKKHCDKKRVFSISSPVGMTKLTLIISKSISVKSKPKRNKLNLADWPFVKNEAFLIEDYYIHEYT